MFKWVEALFSDMVSTLEVISEFGLRQILYDVTWKNEMKYVTISWVLMALAAAVLHYAVSPVAGFLLAAAGGVLIMYSVHTYWNYENMRDSDDFDHNPVYGAIIGTTLMYVFCIIAASVLLAVWAVISSVIGYPLVLPGIVLTYLAFLLYRWWR